jgi:hypothetical protein
MSNDKKLVLVLERSSENLGITKDGNEIVLEGIFAQFGVVNNNDRIYEENEYLPHLDYLQKKIKDKRLLGELDHPEKFDISLSKVSHVIEKLEYDKGKRQVVGRVRLLDTPSGRIAKELVESGVPISISSRAAGLVESNKKVKIKKIFTYDLVADPGFENAVLSKMNESLGIINENVAIYDVSGSYPTTSYNDLLEDLEDKTQSMKDKNSSDNMEYVTSEELNTYSLILKEEVEEIHRKIATLSESSELAGKLQEMSESIEKMQKFVDGLATTVDSSIKYGDYVAEKLDKVIDYTDYVAKTLDDSIQYSNYIAEKTDKSIQYGEYLKEQIEKGIAYSEYLKECLEKSVSYTEYVAEKADKSIQYSEYVAEKASKGIAYTEYVAEQASKGIEYTEYVAEEATKGIKYAEYIGENLNDAINYTDYLGESLNKGIAYTEYIGEQTQSLADYTEFMLNESGVKVPAKTTSVKTSDYNSLTGKVDSILESIQKQKIDNADSSLNEARKQKVSEGLDERNQKTTGSALRSLIGESKVEMPTDKWLTEAPEEYKTLWESLDSSTQTQINAQAKFYKLETSYQIKNFWQTRNLTGSTNVSLNENVNTGANQMPTLGYNEAYLEAIKNNLDRFKK